MLAFTALQLLACAALLVFADGRALIDESLEGIERITAIVDQIRRFSRGGGGERERAELDLLHETVARMARPRLHTGVPIERRFGSVPAVECAPRELEQVLLNLLLNAADAVGERGTIRLSTTVSGLGLSISYEIVQKGTGVRSRSASRSDEAPRSASSCRSRLELEVHVRLQALAVGLVIGGRVRVGVVRPVAVLVRGGLDRLSVPE